MRNFLKKSFAAAMAAAVCLTASSTVYTQNNKVSAYNKVSVYETSTTTYDFLLKGVHYPGCLGNHDQCAFIVENCARQLPTLSDSIVEVNVNVPSDYWNGSSYYPIIGIAPKVFFDYKGMKTLTISQLDSGIGYIGESVAEGCSNLKSLKISSVHNIEKNAFKDCTSLKDVNIENVNTFSSGIFYNCTSLENVKLPENMFRVSEEMFYNCVSLENIRLPEKIYSVSESSFEGCKKLKEINIPSKAKYISEAAFKNCESLEKITINNPECNIFDSPETIDSNAVIYGYPDSTAQAYAEKYGRKFIEIIKGDVNGDGKVNVDDVITLQQWLFKEINSLQSCADINEDGTINAFDLVLLKRMVMEQSKLNEEITWEISSIAYSEKFSDTLDDDYIITSTKELGDYFYSIYGDILDCDVVCPENETVDAFLKKYDDEFFENNVLLMKPFIDTAYTDFIINGVECNNKSLSVYYKLVYIETDEPMPDYETPCLALVIVPKSVYNGNEVEWLRLKAAL